MLQFVKNYRLRFPLLIYSKSNKLKNTGATMLFEPEAIYETRKPNINPEIITKLAENFKHTPAPEQIFYYITPCFIQISIEQNILSF
jgi:hypothetical protein